MIDDGWDLPAPGQETLDDAIADATGETPGGLFGDDEQFHKAFQHWDGMPEFTQEDLQPWRTLVVKFATPEDRQRFAELVGQPIRGSEPRGIWFPKLEIGHYWDKRYRDASADVAPAAGGPES